MWPISVTGGANYHSSIGIADYYDRIGGAKYYYMIGEHSFITRLVGQIFFGKIGEA